VRVIAVGGDRIAADGAAAFLEQFSALVAGQQRVVLDVASVGYVDWLGFEALVEGLRRCSGRVVFAGMRPELAGLFLLSHLDGAGERYASVADALAELDAPRST
jgi:anti-anti-sigma regulatory factor